MKLLLTSGGINNRAVAAAFTEMVGKSPAETKIGFVPTAANVELGNKEWFISQYRDLWRRGYSWIDVVDIAAADVGWQSRLVEVDVIYVGGGNTFYLLDQARKTGFDVWLKEHLDGKVYVGGSAGSVVATPSIAVAGLEAGDENTPGLTDLTGFGLVDFELEPHCDAARLESVGGYAATTPNTVYAIDDLTAIQIIDGEVKVLSKGSWKKYE